MRELTINDLGKMVKTPLGFGTLVNIKTDTTLRVEPVEDEEKWGKYQFLDAEVELVDEEVIEEYDNFSMIADIAAYILLENKYSSDLEGYDEEREKRNQKFLEMCIERNNDCLEMMKETQELLFRSSKEDLDEELLAKVKIIKHNFDLYLKQMSLMSDALNILFESEPNPKYHAAVLRLAKDLILNKEESDDKHNDE